MKVVTTILAMQRCAEHWRSQRKTIGFVPTMGYLHDGHLSLIEIAKKKSAVVVVSIFVNPAQFEPWEDFQRYPRDLSRDKRLLLKQGHCDVLFMPQAADLYPVDFSTYVTETKLTQGLCGAFRPTHFRGVTTIVEKLLNIVKPHYAVFGQKDYQQGVAIRHMVRDLNNDCTIIIAPTRREPDGLAMSSRNQYLSPSERRESLVLSQALARGKHLIEKKKIREAGKILSALRRQIRTKPLVKLQYLDLVDAQTLTPIKKIYGMVVIAVAAYVGKTRLIDNIMAKVD